MFEERKIRQLLASCKVPYLNQDLIKAGAVSALEINGRSVRLGLTFHFPLPAKDQERLIIELKALLTKFEVDVSIAIDIRIQRCQPHVALLSGIKNIIAISSGKGGVGKSTTAVNIALALKQAGARVGLLDADIYGPNQPHMLGIEGEPEVIDQKLMVPMEKFGLQTISFGNLIGADTPAIWRGPMVTKALLQLFLQTRWQQLDYLIVDMPPGTGDIHLTLSKKIPVSGAVVVTTPQDIALIDARKGLEMFHKVEVNLLGIIENMSMFECPHCHEKTALFGDEGGEKLAAATGVPVLGKIPLSVAIRRDADRGVPTVEADPHSDLANVYRDIALSIAARLSLTSTVEILGKKNVDKI
ncbi:MAG: iron-sulfur cluster carrier protein ApbC [Coxiella sp. (in: Bacteria)]|nr:MAG: iron-sulfur cluster carrier protein ApbC [Coxiella sp. (in: g-proteobacteria)]